MAARAARAGRDVFSVDLSSARVRTALGLLDGIRAGQPLAALLGYRIERRLRAGGASRSGGAAPGRAASADFHAAYLAPGSGELEAEAPAVPPGDGGVGGEAGLAEDG